MHSMHSEDVQKLVQAGRWLLVILSIFFIILSLAALRAMSHIGSGDLSDNTITVSGEGEVFAVPDVAEFTFAVITEEATVDVAQTAAAEAVNSILAYLDGEGIAEEDVKTEAYNLYPKYEFQRATPPSGATEELLFRPEGRQVLVGYEVRQSVRVKVRDIEVVGAALSGVGARGATNISGILFTIDDTEALEREARQQAIAHAQEKARALADDLDVRLVRIVQFREGGGQPVFRALAETFGVDSADEQAVVPQLPAGENRIVSNVSITYEIR